MSLDAEQAQAPPRSDAGRRALPGITLAAAAVALAACSSRAPLALGSSPAAASSAEAVTLPAAPAATPQSLSETGSSLMAPLFALWGPVYHSRFSQVTLRTTSSSSGTGVDSAAAGTGDVISSVRSAPGSIGYVGVSYLSQVRAAGEGEGAPGNSAGSYVLPAAGTVQAALASSTNTPAIETISLVSGSGARAYPIVNYEYAIVSTAQGSAIRARDLRAFLSWAITSGAAQLAQVNFQPLPSSVVTLSGTQIAEIKG